MAEVDVTLSAATQLRAMARDAGVVGVPRVRLRVSSEDDTLFELVVEDRMAEGDVVSESRGIRFHVDPRTWSAMGPVTVDLQGSDVVLRPHSRQEPGAVEDGPPSPGGV